MRAQNSYRIMLAAAAFALVAGATESRADSCSASASSLITRSAGGTCAAALALNQEFTLAYRVTNASIIDDPLSANDGNPVAATIQSGEQIVGTLAQATSGAGGMQLPSVLEFVPVCSVGSSLNVGLQCDPMAPNCGTGNCGCVSSQPGVTCVASGGNIVNLEVGQDIPFNPGQQKTIATIRVKVTDTVDATLCGEFFTRMDSTGDVIETTDAQCDSIVTAGAQASADLHAPVCLADIDCGDTECNACVGIGTDPHCEAANIGSACGTDANTTDCVTPACVNVDGIGECQQGQNDVDQGTTCDNNAGDPVSALECQTPVCDGVGICANTADPTQNGDPCGTDANETDCLTPACLDGTCEQEQTAVGEGASCTNNDGVPVDDVDCQVPLCDADGACTNTADPSQNGDPCGTDANGTDCLAPACLEGACEQEQTPVAESTSCTNNDGIPVPGVDCQAPLCDADGVCANEADPSQEGDPCTGDGVDCTTDLCDANGMCVHTEDNAFCDDGDECTSDRCDAEDDCVHELICVGAICRSPGYWATHSGYEKDGINVGQLVIDAVGPLEVCGQTIDSTSNLSKPYLAGLGLDSSLEALCVKTQGVKQRSLYRQLVAAALNCGISGGDCETVTDPFVDVSFDDCNALCAGDMLVDPPSIGECVDQLDCFNNGGQVIMGDCAYGTCAGDGEYCGGDFGDCALYMDEPQECVDFPGNCHEQDLCNEDIGVCPESGPASSSAACREANSNSCTIDDCD